MYIIFLPVRWVVLNRAQEDTEEILMPSWAAKSSFSVTATSFIYLLYPCGSRGGGVSMIGEYILLYAIFGQVLKLILSEVDLYHLMGSLITDSGINTAWY